MEVPKVDINPKLPTFVFWPADQAGCGYVRCEVPARSINRLGLANVILIDPKDNSIPIVKFAMLQRNVSADRLEILLKMREEYGTLVVLEEDDNFTALPFDNPAFFEFHPSAFKQMGVYIKQNEETRKWDDLSDFGEKEGFVQSLKGQVDKFHYPEYSEEALEIAFEKLELPQEWREYFKDKERTEEEKKNLINRSVIWKEIPRNNFHEVHRHSIAQADLVTVTTHHLADVYSKLNPNVVILPNCIDLEEPAYKNDTAVSHDGIIIGWAGSLTHLGDLKICAPAIKQVLLDNDNTRLLIGAEFRAYEQIFKDLPGVPQFIKKVEDFYENKNIMASKTSESEESEVVSDCGRYIYRRGTSVARYPRMLRDIDIGVVPGRYGMSFYEGKCLDQDTRISTSTGVIKASEIVVGDKVWNNGWKTVEAVEHQKTRMGLEITTKRGISLKVTPEHGLSVDGNKIKACDLNVGDNLDTILEDCNTDGIVSITPCIVYNPVNMQVEDHVFAVEGIRSFNSDLKGLEMSGKRIPIIASPLGEYLFWRPESTGCFIVKKNRHRMWHKYLSLLVKDKGLRNEMADRALEFAYTRHIDKWAPQWVESYLKRMNNLAITSQTT